MIEVIHLSKSFSGQKVLDDINLSIASGEFFVILGESGSGKSVLLRHLIGLLQPDQGSVVIGKNNISTMPERELLNIRKDIGFLFQEGALYDFFTVHENVAFPLEEHTTLDQSTIEQKVKRMLEVVDLHDVNHKFPSELSGGMKKRVALARAMILEPKVIFCDEPTSGLDPIRSKDISDLIRQISKKLQCTTIITSHDVQNSLRIADRLALIRNGQIIKIGTKQELQFSEDSYVREFISGALTQTVA